MTWKKSGGDEWIFRTPQSEYNNDGVHKLRIDYLPGKISDYKYEIYAIGKFTSSVIQACKTKEQAINYIKKYIKNNKDEYESPGHIIFSQGIDLKTMRWYEMKKIPIIKIKPYKVGIDAEKEAGISDYKLWHARGTKKGALLEGEDLLAKGHKVKIVKRDYAYEIFYKKDKLWKRRIIWKIQKLIQVKKKGVDVPISLYKLDKPVTMEAKPIEIKVNIPKPMKKKKDNPGHNNPGHGNGDYADWWQNAYINKIYGEGF